LSIRASLAWSYGSHGVGFVVTLAAGVVIARLLTPAEMGTFATANALVGLFSAASTLLISPYLLRAAEIDKATLASAFTLNAAINVGIAAVLLATGLALPDTLGGDVATSVCVLSLAPLISVFELLPSTMLTRSMSFSVISSVTALRLILVSLATIGFALAGLGYLSPALALVTGYAFSAATLNVIGREFARPSISFRGWKVIARFGLHMFAIAGVSTLAMRATELVIARSLGVASLGLYARASALAGMVWDGAYGLSTRVLFVQLSKEMRETGQIGETFLRSTQIATGIMCPLTLTLAILSGPITSRLYGEAWMGMAPIFAVMMLAQFVLLGVAMAWELCVLRERTSWQARVETIKVAAGFAASVIGAMFSATGAAAGRLVEAASGLWIYRRAMDDFAGTARGSVFRAYGVSAICALVAAAPLAAAMRAATWAPDISLSWLAVSLAACAAVWFAALRLFRHPIAMEAGQMVLRIWTNLSGARR